MLFFELVFLFLIFSETFALYCFMILLKETREKLRELESEIKKEGEENER